MGKKSQCELKCLLYEHLDEEEYLGKRRTFEARSAPTLARRRCSKYFLGSGQANEKFLTAAASKDF